MNSMDPAIDLTLRLGLAALFGVAAAHKLTDRARFRATLEGYGLPDGALVPAIAAVLPVAELATSVLFLVPRFRGVGVATATVLLILYSAAISTNLLRGRLDVECGCFGWGENRTIGWHMVARNALLCGLALATLSPPDGRVLLWVDVLSAAGATATLAACWIAADGMIALAPARRRLRGAS